jgi:spoIIIJ-associated protein
MSEAIVVEGLTIEEALDVGAEKLGIPREKLDYEIVEEPTKSIFGLKGKPARLQVWERGTAKADPGDQEVEEDEDVPDGIMGSVEADVVEEASPSSGETSPGNVAEAEEAEVTDEELDQIADTAVSAVKGVLGAFGISATIDEYEGDDGEIILDVVGDDLAILIGRHGRTLEALQTVVVAVTNRKLGKRHPLVVDVEGYRSRRREKLEEMAHRTADRAARGGRPVALRPMSAFERRVVHVALRDDRRVTTESEGDEPNRRVVVSPK